MVSHLERVGGFSGKHVCFFASCLDFPRFQNPAPQGYVAVGHTLGRRLGVRVMVGGGELGSASGDGPSGTINWHWSETTAALQLTYDLPPVQWLDDTGFGATFGAGPLFAWVRSGRGVLDAYPKDSTSVVTQVGLELRAAVTAWPYKGRHYFFGLELGYRFLPGRTEGPYPLDTGSGALPAFHASYNRLSAGGVVGLRFSFP